MDFYYIFWLKYAVSSCCKFLVLWKSNFVGLDFPFDFDLLFGNSGNGGLYNWIIIMAMSTSNMSY